MDPEDIAPMPDDGTLAGKRLWSRPRVIESEIAEETEARGDFGHPAFPMS